MNMQDGRRSAQIIPFPLPGARRRGTAALKAGPKQKAQIFEAGTAIGGDAWYHEAAIVEADRSRKP